MLLRMWSDIKLLEVGMRLEAAQNPYIEYQVPEWGPSP